MLLQRRLVALVVICLALVFGWFFFQSFFSVSRTDHQPTSQISSDFQKTDEGQSVTFDYNIPSDIPDAPPVHISFKLSNSLLSEANKQEPPHQSPHFYNTLKDAILKLENAILQERQKRLKEIENLINAELSKHRFQCSLGITKDGVVASTRAFQTKKSSIRSGGMNQKVIMESELLESNQEQYAKQIVEPYIKKYEKYILDILHDPEWTKENLHPIQQIIRSDFYTLSEKTMVGRYELRPDYKKIAIQSQEQLYPVAQALYKAAPAKDPASLANFALAFVQSIPSTQYTGRLLGEHMNISFTMPLKTLSNNKGDPDSKTVLLGSLLSILTPDFPVLMLQLDSHSFIGLPLDKKNGARSILYEGLEFVMADPSSPLIQPFGKLDPRFNKYTTLGDFLNVYILNDP